MRIAGHPAGWSARRVNGEAGRPVSVAGIAGGRREFAAHGLRVRGVSRGDAVARGLRAIASNPPPGDR